MSPSAMAETATNGVLDESIASAAPAFTTDCLIVGTGPAGGALSMFLAQNGIKGLAISRDSSTSNSPRAHITNMATVETFLDVGIEEKVRKLATPWSYLDHTRFISSLIGEEYAKIHAWGNGPLYKGKYEIASPVEPMDIPQNLLEPELIRYALAHGFQIRFDTELISFTETEDDKIDVFVKDLISGHKYKIQTKYLFGADGARSTVINQLGLPLTKKKQGSMAWSVQIKADLRHRMQNRSGNLHWIYQPETDHPDFAWIGFPRLVHPWDEWLIIFFPTRGFKVEKNPSTEDWIKRCKQFIGDESVDVEIIEVTRWYHNHIYAETYSKGNVFCLGDAVHRHPPANGLGSNTSIQDAYNLAWKIAYNLKGKAGPKLLDTYTVERQPVGQGIVERANESYLNHTRIWNALGLMKETVEERIKHMEEMKKDTEEGRQIRNAFREAVEGSQFEYSGVGIEMNQRYYSSSSSANAAVYTEDQGEAPKFTEDTTLNYQPTTYPGARVPHAWLNKAVATDPISTIHLTGHGRFTLLTGIGGESWRSAAANVSQRLGVEIKVISIGFRQDFEDIYFDWSRLRGVEESGCVLVRPDRFVAWRSKTALKDDVNGEKLLNVFKKILSVE